MKKVYLSDLLPGQEVTLIITKDARSASVKTTVIESNHKYGIVLDVARKDDRIIPLSTKEVSISLEGVIEDRLYVFKFGELSYTRSPSPRYVAVCMQEGSPKNRRKAVRLRINVPAKLVVKSTAQIVDCRLYDVSVGGVAVILPSPSVLTQGAMVDIHFRHGWDNEGFRLSGIIARVEPIKQEFRVGIEFDKTYPCIDKLVADIQREELKRHRMSMKK